MLMLTTLIPDTTENIKEGAYNTNTPNTQFSPQGWDGLDANSPLAHSGFYTTPNDPLSPNAAKNDYFTYDLRNDSREQFLDICKLPVVLGELAADDAMDPSELLAAAEPSWSYTQYAEPLADTHVATHADTPFIDQDDSLGYDAKCITWSDHDLAADTHTNDRVITEFIINSDRSSTPTAARPRRSL